MRDDPTDHSRPFTSPSRAVIPSPVLLLTKREWRGAETSRRGWRRRLPEPLTYLDPLVFAPLPRRPRTRASLLGKVEVFKARRRAILRDAEQIPVYRAGRAADAYPRPSRRSTRQGRRDLPRGHADPRPRPLADARQDRCGADGARDAVSSRPVASGGPQEVLAPYSKRLRLLPRRTMKVRAGAGAARRPARTADHHRGFCGGHRRIMAAITARARGPARREGPGRPLRPTHARRSRSIGKATPLEEAA